MTGQFGTFILRASWVDYSGMECETELIVIRPQGMSLGRWHRFLRKVIRERVGQPCAWSVRRPGDSLFSIEVRGRLVP
jgi:hypothetical protein